MSVASSRRMSADRDELIVELYEEGISMQRKRAVLTQIAGRTA
jgi:hypothetical protein